MNYTFKGINSEKMGVTVTVSPNSRDAEARVLFHNIDGRDGAIFRHEGVKPFQLTMSIAVEFEEDLEAVRGWMQGDGELIFSSQPDRYINAKIYQTIDWVHLYGGIYQADITFDILDPYWYEVNPGTWGRELIKDDFSDFIPHQGSTVEVNKTFPIEVFKGGRNLVLESLNFQEKPISAKPIIEVSGSYGKLDIFINNPDNLFNGNYVANIMVNTSKSFRQISKLPQGTEYTAIVTMRKVSGDNGKIITLYHESDDSYKNLIGSDSVGDTFKHTYSHRVRGSNSSIHPHLGVNTQPNGTRIEISSIKYVLGHIDGSNEPYSPAPEDGYGLDLPNGAYHIKTSGGTSPIKYRANTIGTENIKTLSSMKIHPFLPMRLYDNRTNSNLVPVNETTHWENTSIGTTPTNIQVRVELNARPEDPLNFIASNPSILTDIGTEWKDGSRFIDNEGTTASLPKIRIEAPGNTKSVVTFNGTEIIYTMPAGEDYVELDMGTGIGTYEGHNRNRFFDINMKLKPVPIGRHKVTASGNTKVRYKKGSRWR